jgi:small subunit ribosomal protein S2
VEKQKERGEFNFLPKKEALMRERELARLNFRLGGLKEMRRLPNLLFIVDVRRDNLAVKEANTLGIPIIAMVDTNCDPDPIDYIIPSNDDAIRAIKLMVSTIADAVLEGHAILSTLEAEEEEAAGMEEEEALERYLGPSTLAKIQAAAEEDEEEEPAAVTAAEEASPPAAEAEVTEEAEAEEAPVEEPSAEAAPAEAEAPAEPAEEPEAEETEAADEPAEAEEAETETADEPVEAEAAETEEESEKETE